jgi:hypothetical protein
MKTITSLGTKFNDLIIITTRLFRLMQQHFVINLLQ